ncbi:MAG: hypothetical protein LBU51_07950 [Bacteroidales bacterium]|jgi:DNA-binding MarR family transcriptional regulator|nr:hypothetical protein [Bacteroidales bacterium]
MNRKLVIIITALVVMVSCGNRNGQNKEVNEAGSLEVLTEVEKDTIKSVIDSMSIDSIFKMNIEQHMISRGNNMPDFNARKDSVAFLLFILHQNLPVSAFIEKTGFSKEKTTRMIRFLEEKNWLHKVNGFYKPTVFIANKSDGEKLYKYAEPISKAIVEEIIQELPDIKKLFSQTDIAKKQSFDVWSFFILSNVLLDNWQINNVEKEFLKQNKRPLRHGKRYYYQISEHIGERESFGIYGNQYQNGIRVYGNNRNNLIEDKEQHIITDSDSEIFDKMAQHFSKRLLKVLNDNKNYAENIYKKSEYSEEISFEEFFIWWYHFIYSQVTDKMSEEKLLTIPESGNFIYELK